MRAASVAMAGLLATAVAPAAHAQYDAGASMDLGMGYGQIAMSQSALSGTRAIGRASDRKARERDGDAKPKQVATAAKPARAPVGKLTFNSSPSVSNTVHTRFAEQQAGANKALAGKIREEVAAGGFQKVFAGILSGYGGDPRNLADVSSAYYMTIWHVIHDRNVSTSQARGVRDQMREGLSQDPDVMRLSDAQKQEISETLALHTAVTLISYDQLKAAGNPQKLAAWRDGIQNKLVPQGPNLEKMVVTDRGFRAR